MHFTRKIMNHLPMVIHIIKTTGRPCPDSAGVAPEPSFPLFRMPLSLSHIHTYKVLWAGGGDSGKGERRILFMLFQIFWPFAGRGQEGTE